MKFELAFNLFVIAFNAFCIGLNLPNALDGSALSTLLCCLNGLAAAVYAGLVYHQFKQVAK